MQTIIIDEFETEISFAEVGQGPCLFLIHGFGGSHHDWSKVTENLSKRFRVITPNFTRQTLNYSSDEKPLKFSELVTLLARFVEAVAPQSQGNHFVGASFGGAMVWGLMMEFPHLVKESVLLGPMPPNPGMKMRNQTLKTFLDLARHPTLLDLYLWSPLGKLRIPLVESIFHAPWIRPEKKRKFAHLTRRKTKVISQVIRCFSWIVRQENWPYWESRFHKITQPTLILYGVDDHIFDETVGPTLKKGMVFSELKVVENAGHLIMNEQPQVVEAHILDFFGH